MTKSIIWLHDSALLLTHPVFKAARGDAKVIYIWDDEYFKAENYSLKRLVFIYETLCEMPVEIIRGDTLSTLLGFDVVTIYIPATTNTYLQRIVSELAKSRDVNVINEAPFVVLKNNKEFRRFFSYWNQIAESAFTPNTDVVT
jgi:hypothetical protein